MSAARALLLALVAAASVVAAGCTTPEEATSPSPEVQPSASPSPATLANGTIAPNATTTTPEPTPSTSAAPTAPPPAISAPVATSPPPASSTPPPPAPAPSPTPPPPTPSPAPAPSPTPATSPTPTPATTPPPAPWPREGSYVTYRVQTGESAPDGSYIRDTYTNASWAFHNGDWSGTCAGDVHQYQASAGWNNTTITQRYSAAHPPHWPLFDTTSPPAPGQPTTAWTLWECTIRSQDTTFTGADSQPFGGHDVPTYTGDRDDGHSSQIKTAWSRNTGLVLSWSDARSNSGSTGELISTDAPL